MPRPLPEGMLADSNNAKAKKLGIPQSVNRRLLGALRELPGWRQGAGASQIAPSFMTNGT